MKTILIFCVTLFLSSKNLFAQARLYFDSTLQIENEKYQYVEIIDQRRSSVVGTIKNSYIETEGQFINDLEKHINTIMMKSDGRDTLLAVLYDCKVEDKPYYGDIVVYHFDATFYSGRGNQPSIRSGAGQLIIGTQGGYY